MRAIVFDTFGGPEVLQLRDVPEPEAGVGQVLIEVKAIGVNPVDWKLREGYLAERIPHQFPVTPGWDVAGIVRALGVGVSSLQVGDEVWAYCRRDVVQQGSYAEYMVLPEYLASIKPASISFTEAAAVPLAGLTAWQALHDAAKLSRGGSVLIHAAAGGVGAFAVQLARRFGAEIVGTASAGNAEFVRQMGADRVIDYTSQDVRAEVRKHFPEGVDVVFDCVGGKVTEESAELVAADGCLVTIANFGAVEGLKQRGIGAMSVFVRPDREQLAALGELAASERLQVHVEEVYPLAEAARAQERSKAGHVRGKLVLVP